jgi:hypothetical protein
MHEANPFDNDTFVEGFRDGLGTWSLTPVTKAPGLALTS